MEDFYKNVWPSKKIFENQSKSQNSAFEMVCNLELNLFIRKDMMGESNFWTWKKKSTDWFPLIFSSLTDRLTFVAYPGINLDYGIDRSIITVWVAMAVYVYQATLPIGTSKAV